MLQSATLSARPAARRRFSRLLGLALVLVALSLVLAASASAFVSRGSGGGWVMQRSGTTTFLADVAFADASHGWAVGNGGTILATSDGGATWSAQSSGTTNGLYGVSFPDANGGWAMGDQGTIVTNAAGQPPKPAGPPKIVKLKPPSAKRNTTVTISGLSFGAAQGTSYVKFGSKKCTVYSSWSDGQITCQVPAKAKYGAVKVTVMTSAGKSNGKSFKVKR